jgi:hypothetical protein
MDVDDIIGLLLTHRKKKKLCLESHVAGIIFAVVGLLPARGPISREPSHRGEKVTVPFLRQFLF